MVSVFGIKRLIGRQCHKNALELAIERGPVLAFGFAFVIAFKG